ncbi:cell division protein FtsQ/DivIB [Bacillus carboniphilus]|uniref:Cell division protein DivIB n=1 Tax=Bacillus carboniphilus TaxID=86663 RepID=A0ABP3G116_9BACI
MVDKSKVVSIEDRIPKLKKDRRKKANKRIIFIITMFFLLIVCVIYFQSPLSHVNNISVKGNSYLTQDEIISTSELSRDDNIWGIDEEKIAQKIDELEQIQSTTVHIDWPNNILIEVNEWRRVAYYKKDLDFFPILENGDMLNQKEENIPVHAPLLFDFSDGKALERMVQELIKLPEEIVRSISEIYLTPTSNDQLAVTVYMNDGFEVKATIRTFSTKMGHYPSIVSQLNPNIKGIIDLTVGAYFRPYESQVEEEQEITLDDTSSSTTNEN